MRLLLAAAAAVLTLSVATAAFAAHGGGDATPDARAHYSQ